MGEIEPSGVSTAVAQLLYVDDNGQSRPLMPDTDRGVRYLTEINAWVEGVLSPLNYGLVWNALSNSFDYIDKEFIEPFRWGTTRN